MSKKRFKALIAALLLALTLSISSPLLITPSTVLATECDITASGGC